MEARINVDTSLSIRKIDNKVSNMNMWSYHKHWLTPFPKGYFRSVFPFVEEMQFMSATGGNSDFDLFQDPDRRDVLDDYEFSPLITACRNVIEQGMRPVIKTGSIPMKYSKIHTAGVFGTNMYPPDDYAIYFDYIKAMAKALVNEFGIDSVKTWRWGCFTEFENKDWLIATSEEYCKIYDYTAAAIQEVLGYDIAIGAHCAGYNDDFVKNFITHCASGINCFSGERGSRLTYLAVSYYDAKLCEVHERPARFSKTIDVLRGIVNDAVSDAKQNGVSDERLKKLGFSDLYYGIDEGKILDGDKGANVPALSSRIAGNSKQAAYDAMLVEQMINHDIRYFSAWAYHTQIFTGVPTISYHVASEFSKMIGSIQVGSKTELIGEDAETSQTFDAVASVDEKGQIYLMIYHLGDDGMEKPFRVDLRIPMKWKKAMITTSYLDDRSNFFDEWVEDRKANEIDAADFNWSPDGTELPENLITDKAKRVWEHNYPRYMNASELYSESIETEIEDDKLRYSLMMEPNSAIFVKITSASI